MKNIKAALIAVFSVAFYVLFFSVCAWLIYEWITSGMMF